MKKQQQKYDWLLEMLQLITSGSTVVLVRT